MKSIFYYNAIIAVLIGALISLLGYLMMSHGKSESIDVSSGDFELLSPLRQSMDKKYFLINFGELKTSLTEIAEREQKQKVAVSIYFEFINTGASISINREQKFYPSSLTKVPTAMIIYKQIEDGKRKLSDRFTITKDVKSSSWGTLYQVPDGSQIELADLIQAMLVQSDNTAHQVLYRSFGVDEANTYGEAVGLEELFDSSGKTTAREYARIFRSLYTANYLSPENSEFLLKLLSQAQTRNYLVSGIPDEVTFSHKIGRDNTRSIALDAGIVYIPNKPYLIIVVIDGQNNKEYLTDQKIQDLMKEISQKVYKSVAK